MGMLRYDGRKMFSGCSQIVAPNLLLVVTSLDESLTIPGAAREKLILSGNDWRNNISNMHTGSP